MCVCVCGVVYSAWCVCNWVAGADKESSCGTEWTMVRAKCADVGYNAGKNRRKMNE